MVEQGRSLGFGDSQYNLRFSMNRAQGLPKSLSDGGGYVYAIAAAVAIGIANPRRPFLAKRLARQIGRRATRWGAPAAFKRESGRKRHAANGPSLPSGG